MSHITVKDANDPTYKDLYLQYADNETLWHAIWQDWTYWSPADWPDTPQFANIRVRDAWEFRYDSGRQRYLARRWQTDPNDPNGHGENPNHWTKAAEVWTDYLGDEPWGDYTVTQDNNEPAVTERVRFLDGLGIQAQETLGGSPQTRFFHGDLIGSTIRTTDGSGYMASSIAYSAFGEQLWHDEQGKIHIGGPLPDNSPRHAYAGAYGYESGPWGQLPDDSTSPGPLVLYGANTDLPPLTLMHVGERWYELEAGRFIQRDRVGIDGGINVYLYCDSGPLTDVDPEGLSGGKSLNWGSRLRFGPSARRIGYRKWAYPWALRYKDYHLYGWKGIAGFVGLVCTAWDIGYGVGTALDELHPWTERKWHEHIGEWLYWEVWRGGGGGAERQGNGDIVWY